MFAIIHSHHSSLEGLSFLPGAVTVKPSHRLREKTPPARVRQRRTMLDSDLDVVVGRQAEIRPPWVTRQSPRGQA